jgi:hypothetical protein
MPHCRNHVLSHRSYIPGTGDETPDRARRDNLKAFNELSLPKKELIDRTAQFRFFEWRPTPGRSRLRMMRRRFFWRHKSGNLAALVGCLRKGMSIRT